MNAPNKINAGSADDAANSSTESELFSELSVEKTSLKLKTSTVSKFIGIDNPRHLRVINSPLVRPRKREEIDRISGASNGPELIAELRRRGLSAPCQRTSGIDRDGYPVKFGVYEFDSDDRRKLSKWMCDTRGVHD